MNCRIYLGFLESATINEQRWFRRPREGGKDGGGIGQEDHVLPHKFLKRTFQHRANSAKQLLGWQRTSGNQKSRPLSSKSGGKKYKRWKRRQRRWGGSSVPGREARPRKGILRREVSKHLEDFFIERLLFLLHCFMFNSCFFGIWYFLREAYILYSVKHWKLWVKIAMVNKNYKMICFSTNLIPGTLRQGLLAWL